MTNEKVVLIINVGKKLEDVVTSVQNMSDEANRSQMVERLAASVAGAHGGRYIGLVDGCLILEMPLDNPEAIQELYKRINTDFGLYPTVGVGETSKEAKIALDHALKEKPGSIRVYSHEDQSESESLTKSDKYKAISDKDKENIARTLVSIDENKQIFESLKEDQPEVYAGLVSIVQSISEILSEDKKRQEEEIVDTINKINDKNDRERESRTKKDSNQINRELDKQSEKFQDSKVKEMNAILEALHNEYAIKRKEAMEFMKNEHGEDEILFSNLVDSLFD